jgi:esterase/lipase superfamily enzyme
MKLEASQHGGVQCATTRAKSPEIGMVFSGERGESVSFELRRLSPTGREPTGLRGPSVQQIRIGFQAPELLNKRSQFRFQCESESYSGWLFGLI